MERATFEKEISQLVKGKKSFCRIIVSRVELEMKKQNN